jgi:WhiB family redox-sensing transcriptional regulator
MTITDHSPGPQLRHQQEGTDVHDAQRPHAIDPQHGSPAPIAAMLGLVLGRDAGPTARDLPCQLGDADLWFAELPHEVEEAKALCLGCPLQEACLAGALERREPWGVWGGQLVLQGVVVPRKRPRGRPRKNDVAA